MNHSANRAPAASLTIVIALAVSLACPDRVAAQPAVTPVPAAAAPTLWSYLGIPQGITRLRGNTQNRHGNFPGLESKPLLKSIADPANLLSKNPAIKKAAEVKQEEDLAKQKIKALKYLATIGCGCYPGVKESLIAALDDCTEKVRYTAATEIGKAAKKNCACCSQNCCCDEDTIKKLWEVANARDDKHCFVEPSQRVRDAAAKAMATCAQSKLPAGEQPAVDVPPVAPKPPPTTTPSETVPPPPPMETVPPAAGEAAPNETVPPPPPDNVTPVLPNPAPANPLIDGSHDAVPSLTFHRNADQSRDRRVDAATLRANTLQQQRHALYRALDAILSGRAPAEDLADLRAQAEQLLAASETPLERGRTRLLLNRIERSAESRPSTVETELTNRRVPSIVEGRLTQVVSDESGTPRYGLIGQNGEIQYYVSSMPGVDLRAYLGRNVRLQGTAATRADAQGQDEHTTRRVTPLGGGDQTE